MTLGYLVWWRVADTTLDQDTAAAIADKLGIPAPNRPAPVDVFRKLTGTPFARRVGDEVTRLELHPAESQRTMLVRHVVEHVTVNSVAKSHRRVGEAVFYKPPRDRPSKARLRITMDDPNAEWLTRYADQLRTEYHRSLNAFDEQGVRRLVRAYLNSVQALFVDGVYFLREEAHADQLEWLFDQLGGDCRCNQAPLVDGVRSRGILSNALERAVEDGSKIDLLEAFIPLGVVPNRLWEKLES